MRVIVEKYVEWKLAGETEILGENILQRHFVHHKSHMTRPRARTRAAAVGSQRLTAWAMARPMLYIKAVKEVKLITEIQNVGHVIVKWSLRNCYCCFRRLGVKFTLVHYLILLEFVDALFWVVLCLLLTACASHLVTFFIAPRLQLLFI
jgi:hypothetical protein